MKTTLLTAISLALIGLAPSPIRAQVAQASETAPLPQITYQGRLREGTTLVSGQRDFRFAILDAAGSEQWDSGPQALSVDAGLYSAVLGSTGMPPIPSSLLSRSGLKLRVVVGGATLSPDVDLLPAFQARSAWEVTGGFSGDLAGTQNQTVVAHIQGIPVDLTTTPPTSGQALIYNGTKLVPGTVAGSVGPMGPMGPTGTQGPAGPQGERGATGSAGPMGPQGPAGPQGLPGLQGVAGPAGTDGVAGPSGLNGKTILHGSGDPVVTGAAGLPGDYYMDDLAHVLYGPKVGDDWVGVAGVSLVGPQGGVGAAGPAGPQGPVGPEGPQGSQGPVGPQGSEGPQGAQGPQGPAGAIYAGDTADNAAIATTLPVLTTGNGNTVFGPGSGQAITTGYKNTVVGSVAFTTATGGSNNVVVGAGAGIGSTGVVGGANTILGAGALGAATAVASTNVVVGSNAMQNGGGMQNVVLGTRAGGNIVGRNNIVIGGLAGTNLTAGNYNVYLGGSGSADESYTMRLGSSQTRTYIAGVWNQSVSLPQMVVIGADKQLGTAPIPTTGGAVIATNAPPSLSTDPGQEGEIRVDAGYIYVYLTGAWRRAALSTW